MTVTNRVGFVLARTLGILVLAAAAVGASVDLGIIAAGAFGVMLAPDSIVVDLAAVLAYFTFLPSIAVAVLTMLIGTLMVFGHRSPRWLGKTLVILGIISGAFVALTYVPAPHLAASGSAQFGSAQFGSAQFDSAQSSSATNSAVPLATASSEEKT